MLKHIATIALCIMPLWPAYGSGRKSHENPYHDTLTATWHRPFAYADIKTKDAPRGPYLGNGEIGVVAHTTHRSQTLRIAKVNFVTDGKRDWAGHGPAALPAAEVRISIATTDTTGFRYVMDQTHARLTMHCGGPTGISINTLTTMDEDLIISAVTNHTASPTAIDVATLSLPGATYPSVCGVSGDVAHVVRQSLTGSEARWTSRVAVATRLVGCKPSASYSDDSASITLSSIINPGHTVYVVTAVGGGGKSGESGLNQCLQALEPLKTKTLRQKSIAHDAWWREMWARSGVDTGDSLLNRAYLNAIYMLASATSERTSACGGMYGVWCMDDDMMYHGDIHLNYNSQAGFYSVFSANRPELSLPFFDFLERMIPEGQRRAREEMGQVHPSLAGKSCRGILFPVSALGIGEFYGEYWQQTMDAPFNVPLFSWYYEYTGDVDFLRHRAYPFIRLCGDFYEDYLQRENTPEGPRYVIQTGGHEGSWDRNPPSELALVECTFRLLLRYSHLLDIDADRRAHWQDIVDHLPPYTVCMPTRQPNEGKPVWAKNEDGWDLPCHIIQLHAAYPCETLHLNSPEEALTLARNTLYYYGVSQRGLTETMNELGLSAYVMGARIGFPPAELKRGLHALFEKAETNHLVRDGHHMMEKTAIVETINSMMLQSVDGCLRLFPCWDATPASFHHLRTKGAFLVSAAFDGRRVVATEITSCRGGECKVQLDADGRHVKVMSGRKAVAANTDGQTLTFQTEAGKTYTLVYEWMRDKAARADKDEGMSEVKSRVGPIGEASSFAFR